MRKTALIAYFVCCCCSLFCQVSDETIESKIDSAWNILNSGSDISRAFEISDELLEIGIKQSDYQARVMAYQIKGEYYFYSPNTDSSLYWIRKAFELAKEKNDQTEMGHASTGIAGALARKGNYSDAISHFDRSLRIWKNLRDTNNIIFTTLRKAELLNDADHHSLAMMSYSEAVDLSSETGDLENLGYALIGIGIIHKKQKNYVLAEENLNKSIDIFNEMNLPTGVATAKSNLALVLKDKGKYREAYDIYPNLIKHYESINYAEGVTICTGNMAVCSNRMGNHERALEEATRGLELAKKSESERSKIDLLNEMGIAYLALGKPSEALKWSQKSKKLADQNYAQELQSNAAKTLSDIHAALGNHQKSLEYFKNYAAINDSIYELEKSRQILELQQLHKTAEKEKEIEVLKSEAQLNSLKQKSLVGGILGLMLLSTIIINREIKRRKKTKALHHSELQLSKIERERLEDQLAFKNRELTAQALHIIQKNKMLQEIKDDLELMKNTEKGEPVDIKKVFHKISFEKQVDKNWGQFIQTFKETNESFFNTLVKHFPDLTKSELRLCALIKMNMANKDIAIMLNISDDGVKKARYRLRKKLNLDSDENLNRFILQIEKVFV